MASTALDQVPEGGELVEVEPGNPPKHAKPGSPSEFDELEDFRAVMASMNMDGVPAYVSRIRKSIHPDKQADAFAVTEIASPLFGGYNICYPVIFEDGVRWLLKVPGWGTQDRFSDAYAESLRSEALTMRLLRRETTIPLPEVFAFENSCENELNCPFILMSYVEGKMLNDVWFDRESPKDIVQARRTRALQGIAAAMIQLDKYSFDQGGSLVFDQQDQLSGFGSMLCRDIVAEFQRVADNDPDKSPIYFERGPFSEPKASYTALLNPPRENADIFDIGQHQFLRMSIDLIEEPCDGRKPFVLIHPDFDIQNFIVSEDGELRGIIDWDGVSSWPRSLGNEAYPGWLTRDWDPMMYAWNEDMERGIKPEEWCWEDSPDTLKFYRSVYASAMRPYQHNVPEDPTAATVTTKSLIYQNLFIAVGSMMCRSHITRKFIKEIAAVMQDELPQKVKQEIESENEEDDLQQSAKQETESENEEDDLQQPAKQETESQSEEENGSENEEDDLQQPAKQETESQSEEENGSQNEEDDLQQPAKQETESQNDEGDLQQLAKQETESQNDEDDLQQPVKQETESQNDEENESENEEEIKRENDIEEFVAWEVFDALGENRLSERYRNILITGLQRLVERSGQL